MIFKNQKGVTVIEMIMVILFFVTVVSLITPMFKNMMGQNGEVGFVQNVILAKAQDTKSTEIQHYECADKAQCELED